MATHQIQLTAADIAAARELVLQLRGDKKTTLNRTLEFDPTPRLCAALATLAYFVTCMYIGARAKPFDTPREITSEDVLQTPVMFAMQTALAALDD